ncbi:hypothetical protein APR11_004971 [Nocardia amikacinitolerans]|uniref:hypothetical protein n=1 Tax=Nocardia amikacinitolerans TaxID=756689 RepID=UPI0020A4E058|nr:hypothetical protein [Nocardia amikacinitolerans]MCP2298526.1 hypothetical protein [Nocardia amikacinitolerans]
MSAFHEIFVRAGKSDAEVIRDIGLVAGVELHIDHTSGAAPIHRAVVEHWVIEVETAHDYEDDFGIPFSKYPIVVTIRDLEGNKQREESVARSIFDSLASVGEYSELLVFDLQKLLATTDKR